MEGIELDCYNTYNLMDLARYYNVDVTGLDDNKAAKEVIQELVSRNFEKQKVDQMKVDNEVFYVFNKKRADELPPLYLTKKNRVDVGILLQQSLVCLVEVDSKPFLATVRKVAYGLVQLSRITKAYEQDCAVVGFIFLGYCRI